MKLLIVSHTTHYHDGGRIVGWGPTVRELDALAALFDEIVHVATIYPDPAPASALPYTAANVRLRLVAPAGGDSVAAKLGILTAYPRYGRVIREELARADAVHVRCPANISLAALALLRHTARPPYRWVKFAGNWRPEGGEPWSYALQRRWLAANRHRGVVTVNGRWPDQPLHVHAFDNPCLTDAETAAGEAAMAIKRLTRPVELLFVGALNEGKGVGRALQVAADLGRRGVPCRLRLLGDGPERPRYEAWAREHGVDASFLGWVPRADIAAYYAAAHFILLPSRSEGWPKVLSEAMAYGAVPVASAVSSIPQILAASGTGVALPPQDVDGMAAAIIRYVNDPDAWQAASRAGVAAAPQFGYRAYQRAVAGLFAQAWGIELRQPALPASEVAGWQPAGYSTNGHVRH